MTLRQLSALTALLLVPLVPVAQKKTANDGDWSQQLVTLKGTAEADLMIRVGDIDNLGFGWAAGYDPFSGRSTDPHGFPWQPRSGDVPGLDRILLGTRFGKKAVPCDRDGYADMERALTQPQAIRIPLGAVAGVQPTAATLMLFVDDFQSPRFCSKFVATLNGKRFVDLEKILEVLDQTGPVGKFISVRLPDELLPLLGEKEIQLLIDDPTTGAADGYALDFVKLLINPKPLVYKGTIRGVVRAADTGEVLPQATVVVRGYGTILTDAEGRFSLTTVPVGLNVAEASAPGYATGRAVFDVITGETTDEQEIILERSKTVVFNNQSLREGEAVVMNNIQFAVSSAELSAAARTELDRVRTLMQENPALEIELAGHTSDEGERAMNVRLSQQRVRACQQYLLAQGIDEGRVRAVGYGPDRPLVPNTSEASRARNRRVELKVLRAQ
jgi:OOP family OmpA-OmpF porin